jgi:hypothetical protein
LFVRPESAKQSSHFFTLQPFRDLSRQHERETRAYTPFRDLWPTTATRLRSAARSRNGPFRPPGHLCNRGAVTGVTHPRSGEPAFEFCHVTPTRMLATPLCYGAKPVHG